MTNIFWAANQGFFEDFAAGQMYEFSPIFVSEIANVRETFVRPQSSP